MSVQTSIDAAVVVLADAKTDRFQLTCSCGWICYENRGWVKYRIQRHFGYPDASAREHVTVEAVGQPASKGGTDGTE